MTILDKNLNYINIITGDKVKILKFRDGNVIYKKEKPAIINEKETNKFEKPIHVFSKFYKNSESGNTTG